MSGSSERQQGRVLETVWREEPTLNMKCLCSKVITRGEGRDTRNGRGCDHFRSTAGGQRSGEESVGSCDKEGDVLVMELTFGLTAVVLLSFIIHIHIYFLVGIKHFNLKI